MHMTGRHVSDETRQKMREANLGKKLSRKTRKKLSKALLGIHRSEETRKKMSNAKCGMKFWNNGVKCIRAKKCPKGFKAGLLRKGSK